MSLELDKRQRAMLREMGVRVWLPETPVAAVPVALKVMAPEVDLVKAKADFSGCLKQYKNQLVTRK